MNEDENDLIPRARLAATGATIHDTNVYIGHIRNAHSILNKKDATEGNIRWANSLLKIYRSKLEILIATGDPKKAREI